jgi:aldehyde:ferredoxin oxidoreductase
MADRPFTGWTGRLLQIDLTAGQHRFQAPPQEVYHAYLGGRGMAGAYLRDHVTLAWDDPAMPLLLVAGPLVATASPTSGRMTFMSRSPLTARWAGRWARS